MAALFSPAFYPLVGQGYPFPLHLYFPIDLVTTQANLKIHSQVKGCEPFCRSPGGKQNNCVLGVAALRLLKIIGFNIGIVKEKNCCMP